MHRLSCNESRTKADRAVVIGRWISGEAGAVARILAGMRLDHRCLIAAILHDVGKLGVNDQILNKPGGLTEYEFDMMKRHVEIGVEICSPLRSLQPVLPLIRHHHERFDGSG